MTKNPLDVLKKGLTALKNNVKLRKDSLLEQINQGETISAMEEHWLDNDANFVDEEYVIDILENASDYERGLTQLNSEQQALVDRLKKLGDGIKKRKRQDQPEELQKKAATLKVATPTITQVGSGNGKKNPTPKGNTGQRQQNATLAQRIEVLDWYQQHSGGNQSKTAKHFKEKYPNTRINQPVISSWLKEEPRWREEWAAAETKGQAGTAKKKKQTEHPEVDEMLELWVIKALSDNITISGEILRQKWLIFADLAGIPDDERLKLSDGWLASFKKRCGLRQFRRHGEAGSAKSEDVECERKRLRELIKKYGYQLRDIFNMDETGLLYAMPPDRGLMDRPRSGVKGNKKRLTYALTANADGTEKLPPLVIGKAARPRAFQKKTGTQLGFLYRYNAKAWMTTTLYQEWIANWDATLREQGRHILLLQDNFSAHNPPNGLTNISIENFEPNLTAHIQPNDAGIIRCFKAYYRAEFTSQAIGRYDNGTHPSEIYDLNQLEAMRMADVAWDEVNATTIRKCWVKTGILPLELLEPTLTSAPTVPIFSLLNASPSSASGLEINLEPEVAVSAGLDTLQGYGLLQPRDRLTITDLLNPVGETDLIGSVSDQEIATAVQEMHAAEWVDDNAPTALDEAEPIPPKASRKEALAGALALKSYLSDINDPLARKLECLLAGFGRRIRFETTQNLTETRLTDYFKSLST